MNEDPRYPIGQYEPQPYSADQRMSYLADIQFLPMALNAALSNLDEAQLHTPYRDGGWTVHQLVHHIADSHIHAYVRFKLGYTEDNPTIKTYEEKDWAKTADVDELPFNVSTTILSALHRRWVVFLHALTEEDFNKTVNHPEWGRQTLWFLLGMYAWHGRHHVAQINALRTRMGW